MQLSTISTPALLLLAGGLAVGLAAPAAAHETQHLISGASLEKHSVAGNRLKNNTVTGAQVKESTLGTVPTATTAKRLPALVWHPVTTFENGAENYSDGAGRAVAYAVDAQGQVHLRGQMFAAVKKVSFTLPTALAPSTTDGFIDVPVTLWNSYVGILDITGVNVSALAPNGAPADEPGNLTDLDGVVYSP